MSLGVCTGWVRIFSEAQRQAAPRDLASPCGSSVLSASASSTENVYRGFCTSLKMQHHRVVDQMKLFPFHTCVNTALQ